MRRLVALAVAACAIHAAGALVAAPRGFLALFPRRTGCSAGLGAGSAGLWAQAEVGARRRVLVVGGGVGGLGELWGGEARGEVVHPLVVAGLPAVVVKKHLLPAPETPARHRATR